MTGQPDLFGEIHEDELVKIAREAAEKRGYAIYADFEEYMEQKRIQKKLKFRSGGFYHFKIKKPLEAAGWKCETTYRPTRFYPPGTERGPGTIELKATKG